MELVPFLRARLGLTLHELSAQNCWPHECTSGVKVSGGLTSNLKGTWFMMSSSGHLVSCILTYYGKRVAAGYYAQLIQQCLLLESMPFDHSLLATVRRLWNNHASGCHL